jgi:hypothetical protein
MTFAYFIGYIEKWQDRFIMEKNSPEWIQEFDRSAGVP